MISDFGQISVQFRPYYRLICTKLHANMVHFRNELYAFRYFYKLCGDEGITTPNQLQLTPTKRKKQKNKRRIL